MTELKSSSNTDLYKESFKYFRQFSLNPTQASQPQEINKKGRSKNPAVKCKRDGGQTDIAKEYSDLKEGQPENSTDSHFDDKRVCKTLLPYSKGDILLRYPNEDESVSQQYLQKRDLSYDPNFNCECHKMWGLRSPSTWEVKELTFPSGLLVIKNPFTVMGQRYWISRTLLNFPHNPEYITNMDNLNRLEKIKKGESVTNLADFKLNYCGREFYQTLRWVTFGYHHDWDTKIYSEERKSDFPEDLGDMTRYIAQILGFEDFKAEAAIANYYHMDSTLSGHVDKSEVNQYAPLFSLSFGQSCIFLIGGKTKSERPQPVLLQSGDVAVMSGESRLSYHGVPSILPAVIKPWEGDNDHRFGATISDSNKNEDFIKPSRKKSKLGNPVHNCESFQTTVSDSKVLQNIDNTQWTTFVNKYIQKSRINLNIRQVLFPGQATLSDCLSRSQIQSNK